MSPLARLVTLLVTFYRKAISPLFPRHCRYEPTCSAYMLEAVRIHGAVRGVGFGLRRIGRCHPWAAGGIDRVPERRRAA